jgi:hypothetical protein
MVINGISLDISGFYPFRKYGRACTSRNAQKSICQDQASFG